MIKGNLKIQHKNKCFDYHKQTNVLLINKQNQKTIGKTTFLKNKLVLFVPKSFSLKNKLVLFVPKSFVFPFCRIIFAENAEVTCKLCFCVHKNELCP